MLGEGFGGGVGKCPTFLGEADFAFWGWGETLFLKIGFINAPSNTALVFVD